MYGSYVIAACAFARITGKSPIGLPYRSICSVPMDHEKFAQVSELRRQAEAEADPAKKEALTAQANQLSAEAFTPIYEAVGRSGSRQGCPSAEDHRRGNRQV